MSEAADAMDREALHYLWTPELDPLFWREGRMGGASAWYRHIPFAHWVVGTSKPRTLVELGTLTGVSYSAFCEAAMRNGLETRCFAVDTWQGDEHTGPYGEEVYSDLRRFHDERYSAFSELLRCTFDEAVLHFADSSVDLLHIDGLHTYAAVRHDFDTWRLKLSDRAVVLLHDTNVRERDFGVWRLFEELRTQFPSFEFLHGHGLGVLAVGTSIPSEVLDLCSLRSPAKVHAIRQRFALLGERWWLVGQSNLEQKAKVTALESEVVFLKERIAFLEAEAGSRADAEKQLRARAASRTKQARLDAAKAMARAAKAEIRAES